MARDRFLKNCFLKTSHTYSPTRVSRKAFHSSLLKQSLNYLLFVKNDFLSASRYRDDDDDDDGGGGGGGDDDDDINVGHCEASNCKSS